MWIERCRDPERNPFTALSFPSLFTWSQTYGLTIAGNEHAFLIHSRHDHAYYCPCGTEDACQAMLREIEKTEKHPCVLYLTEAQAKRLEQHGWTIRVREDLSEYLARTSALALREGHASNSFKMKCRHFQQRYTYDTWQLSNADMPRIEALAARQRKDPRGKRMGDLVVLDTELEAFRSLSLQGLMFRTTDGDEAFIFGYENTPGMFTMTMSKHDLSLPKETTAVLVHELACVLDGRYPIINLEEDLGMKGLRQAKMLYSPIGQLMVYEATR